MNNETVLRMWRVYKNTHISRPTHKHLYKHTHALMRIHNKKAKTRGAISLFREKHAGRDHRAIRIL